MTSTRSKVKVKVKVTELLNFRQLAKPCMLAAMTVSPLAGLSGYYVHQIFTIEASAGREPDVECTSATRHEGRNR